MNLNDIVKLWYKTQMGNMHECKKNQFIFADIMWKLWEDHKKFNENDCCLHGNQLNALCADCDDETYHEEQDHKAMKKEKK